MTSSYKDSVLLTLCTQPLQRWLGPICC